jgi:hypothetical protein
MQGREDALESVELDLELGRVVLLMSESLWLGIADEMIPLASSDATWLST